MESRVSLTPLLLLLCAAMDCGNCYRIDTGTLVGVVAGDVVLTIIIMCVVYFCARQKNKGGSSADDNKVYMNMPNR
ncbi:hematopoietic cell signal transducer isoform X3 [Lissotriton helveticus]